MNDCMIRIYAIFILMTGTYSMVSAQRDTTTIRLSEPFKWEHNVPMQWKNKHLPLEIYKINKRSDKSFDLYPQQFTLSFTLPEAEKSLFKTPYSKLILPAALISYGLIAQDNSYLRQLDENTHQEVMETWKGRYPIDDYLQFAPYIGIYALDLCGVKAKHNIRDRTIVMLTSGLVLYGSVQTMKNKFNVKRPDSSKNNSFPSGHTATAFLGAHVLFREYKDVSPWIGVAGYASALTVGSLRVVNKRHWVSDVVAGAGLGILSAEVGYMLLPVFHNLFGFREKEQNLVIAPVIAPDNYGVGLAYVF